MPDAVVLRSVTKTFGETVAVRDLDLAIPQGALYGFIGPNGAGKTTTLRIILSILFPDRGEVSVLGHRSALEAKDRRGATILFSTHVMVQAEQLCDHVVMIHDGEKVLDASLPEIRSRFDPRALVFEPLDPAASIEPLAALPGVEGVARDGSGYLLRLAEGGDVAATMRAAVAALPAARVEIRRPTLEDVFVEIVTASRAAAPVEAADLRATLRDEAAVASGIGAA